MPDLPPKINPVRTFKADLEQTIKSDNISLSDVALAEEKRRRSFNLGGTPAPSRNWSWKIVVAIIIALLLGLFTISQVANLLGKSSKEPETSSFILPPPIINAEDSKKIDPRDIKVEILQGSQEIGKLRYLYFVENNQIIKSAQFFNLLETSAPGSFLRNLNDQFMLGAYQNKGFLILKTDSYESAFAGMLEWEKDLAEDLLPILSGKKVDGVWEDRVEKNKDTRILKEENRNPDLIYAFLDKKTLVIAPDIETFSEVLKRFTAPKPVIK